MKDEIGTVRARVRFLTEAEGGRITPPGDGVRSQLRLGAVSTSCVVRSISGEPEFEPGILHDVRIELLFWDEYAHLIDPSEPVVLLEGSRVVAEGTYLTDEP